MYFDSESLWGCYGSLKTGYIAYLKCFLSSLKLKFMKLVKYMSKGCLVSWLATRKMDLNNNVLLMCLDQISGAFKSHLGGD